MIARGYIAHEKAYLEKLFANGGQDYQVWSLRILTPSGNECQGPHSLVVDNHRIAITTMITLITKIITIMITIAIARGRTR